MRRMRMLSLAVGIAFFPAIAHTQQTIGESADLAFVRGTLTERATGHPVSNVRLRLQEIASGFVEGASVTWTDALGQYVVGVEPGTYTIRTEADGFLIENHGTPTAPILLKAREERIIDFSITRGATISGRVVDEAGEPVAGAAVVAQTIMYDRGQPHLDRYTPYGIGIPFVSRTNDQGEYSLGGYPPGEYFIVVERPGLQNQPPILAPIYYPGTPAPERAMAVRVTNDQPVERVEVTWRDVLRVPVEGRVFGLPEESVPGGTENLELYVASRGRRGFFEIPSMVGSDGRFSALLLPGEAYDLAVYPRAFLDGQRGTPAFAGLSSIFVGDGDIDDVSIAIRPPVDIDGQFVWESTPPVGFDWNDVGAELRFDARRQIWMRSVGTDDRFTIRNVFALAHSLQVRVPEGVYVESASYGGVDALRGDFNPGDDPDATLRIRLGNQAGRVHGIVLASDGAPSTGVTVTLVPDADRRQREDLSQTRITDAAGGFDFPTVVPGTYLVFGWTDIPEGAIESEEFRLPYEPRATRVTVDRLETEDVEVDLIER